MSKLSELLAELKALQPAYNAAEERSLDAEEWSDNDWAVHQQYWAIAEQFLTLLKSVVDSGVMVKIGLEDKLLEVRSVESICWMYGGAPIIKYASIPNAPRLYSGFRLDRVESIEIE